MSSDHEYSNASQIVERERFLNAMRAVANSVTVVTTEGAEGRYGGTVSAFSSVSADPPTVLVCLHSESRISEMVARNGSFCVNVLPYTHQFVSDRFAGRHDNDVDDRFEGIELAEGEFMAPVIAGSTTFCCQILDLLHSGTHRIFVGRVQDVKRGVPEPLIYFDGAYHCLDCHVESGQQGGSVAGSSNFQQANS